MKRYKASRPTEIIPLRGTSGASLCASFSSWICSGCCVQGGLAGGRSLSILSFLRAHHQGCSVIAQWLWHFILYFFTDMTGNIFFSAGKSCSSTLIMTLPCVFLFWLIKKIQHFHIAIPLPLAFIVSDEKSDIYLIGFSCMQRTFFLLLFAGFYLRLSIFLLLYIWMWFFLYFFLTCSLLSCFDMYANVFHQI